VDPGEEIVKRRKGTGERRDERGMVEKFEDLKVWQRGVRLAIQIYKMFSDCRDFGFKDQITRSALSIASNIAEGYERGSNNEFIRFLNIAKGSCGELRTQMFIALRIGYVEKDKGEELIEESREISAMLGGLITTRREKFK